MGTAVSERHASVALRTAEGTYRSSRREGERRREGEWESGSEGERERAFVNTTGYNACEWVT